MHKALALGFAVANGKAPGPNSGSLKPEVQIRKSKTGSLNLNPEALSPNSKVRP